jgi:hypothetical protein
MARRRAILKIQENRISEDFAARRLARSGAQMAGFARHITPPDTRNLVWGRF